MNNKRTQLIFKLARIKHKQDNYSSDLKSSSKHSLTSEEDHWTVVKNFEDNSILTEPNTSTTSVISDHSLTSEVENSKQIKNVEVNNKQAESSASI